MGETNPQKLPLNEAEATFIKKTNTYILRSRIQIVISIIIALSLMTSLAVLLHNSTRNSDYLKRLICASGIGTDCPKPDAKQLQLQKQIAAQQLARDKKLLEASEVRDKQLLKKIQELLDRPSTCKLSNGRSC